MSAKRPREERREASARTTPGRAPAPAQTPGRPSVNAPPLDQLQRLARLNLRVSATLLADALRSLTGAQLDDVAIALGDSRPPLPEDTRQRIAMAAITQDTQALDDQDVQILAAAITASRQESLSAPRARAALAQYLEAMARATLAGGPLQHLLAGDAAQAFGADGSPLATTFDDAWKTVSLCPAVVAILDGSAPVPADKIHLFACRLALAEILAPLAAAALDSARKAGETGRTPVAVARHALLHGWHLRLDDYA